MFPISEILQPTYNDLDTNITYDFANIWHNSNIDPSSIIFHNILKELIKGGLASQTLRTFRHGSAHFEDPNVISSTNWIEDSGLNSTWWDGRSERLFISEDFLESVHTAICQINPNLNLGEKEILLLIKGRGFQSRNGISILKNNFRLKRTQLERKSNISGITAFNEIESQIPELIRGVQTVIQYPVDLDKSTNNEFKDWYYNPARELAFVIPMKSIKTHEIEDRISVQDWVEQPVIMIYAEIGGFNIRDLITTNQANKDIDYNSYYNNLLRIQNLIFPNVVLEDSQIISTLIRKFFYDSVVEDRFLEIGENRTDQNFSIGNKDFDDSNIREIPMGLDMISSNSIRAFISSIRHFSGVNYSINHLAFEVRQFYECFDTLEKYYQDDKFTFNSMKDRFLELLTEIESKI